MWGEEELHQTYSEFTKVIPPSRSSLVSEQSTIGSYNTHSLLAQTFLLIYLSCLDWGVRDGAGAHCTAAPHIESQNDPGLMRTRRE